MSHQAFQSLLAALDGAVFIDHQIAVRRGWKHHADGDAGLVAVHDIEAPGGFVVGSESTLLAAAAGKDNALRFDHFREHAAVGIVGAVGAAHDVFSHVTRAHVHLFDGGGEGIAASEISLKTPPNVCARVRT